MNVNSVIYYILFLFASTILAADKTSSSVSPTLVWVTGTDANGKLATTQSTYYQSFMSTYTTAETPSSGSIGLGSISGTVGEIRTYSMTTISQGNGGLSKFNQNGLEMKNLSFVKLIGVSFIAFISFILLV